MIREWRKEKALQESAESKAEEVESAERGSEKGEVVSSMNGMKGVFADTDGLGANTLELNFFWGKRA